MEQSRKRRGSPCTLSGSNSRTKGIIVLQKKNLLMEKAKRDERRVIEPGVKHEQKDGRSLDGKSCGVI